MSAQTSVRLLGLACMIGSAAFSLINLLEVFRPSMGSRGTVFNPPQFRLYMLTLALVMPGFFAGQLGYYWIGAGGRSRMSRTILVVAGLGCASFSAGTIYAAVTLKDPGIHVIGIVLNQLLAPFLWFVAAIRTRRVRMWKKVWPLTMALIPWLMFWVAVPLGFPRFAAPAVVGMFWLIFGYADFSEASITNPMKLKVDLNEREGNHGN
jgi:hypothetical protein